MSSQLQHGAALCEWVFVIDILIFYGTFSYGLGRSPPDTLVAALQPGLRACKGPPGAAAPPPTSTVALRSVAMI